MLVHKFLLDSSPETASQDASPLYSRLPYELRSIIFEYALIACDESTEPGNKSHISINLLLTCRLVYLETCLLPVKLNKLVNWCYHPSQDDAFGSQSRLFRMCPEQRAAVQSMHLFTQQSWLETGWLDLVKWPNVNPQTIRLTLRYGDWRYWDDSICLCLDPKQAGRSGASAVIESAEDPFEDGSWGQAFTHLHGLRTLHLELETLFTKKEELDSIVARAPTWQFVLGDGNVLLLDDKRTLRDEWVAPPRRDMQQTSTPHSAHQTHSHLRFSASAYSLDRDGHRSYRPGAFASPLRPPWPGASAPPIPYGMSTEAMHFLYPHHHRNPYHGWSNPLSNDGVPWPGHFDRRGYPNGSQDPTAFSSSMSWVGPPMGYTAPPMGFGLPPVGFQGPHMGFQARYLIPSNVSVVPNVELRYYSVTLKWNARPQSDGRKNQS